MREHYRDPGITTFTSCTDELCPSVRENDLHDWQEFIQLPFSQPLTQSSFVKSDAIGLVTIPQILCCEIAALNVHRCAPEEDR